ncbi:MAG: hypothetical protein H0V18_06960 [Pyrinomonadaceae bacterium]|nr:hypothetical protein [Pyrinomonadaceae bacterium]
MGLKKSVVFLVVFVLGLALFLILTRHRDLVTLSFSQSPSPAKANTMVAYALAIPADVPGLSRKSDKENEHLFGPVKSVTHEEFDNSKILGLFTRKQSRLISSISFNVEGNKTEETYYNSGGASVHRTSYSYDSKGRKTAQLMRQGTIYGETIYSYDQQGREIEALEQIGEKTLVTRRYTASYDAQGRQIEAGYSEGGRELKAYYRYSYTAGRLSELSTLNAEGILFHRVVYSYDESGRLIGESAYRPDGKLYKKSLFSYEDGRKKEEMITFNEDGSLNLGLVQIYDGRDNVVEAGALDQGNKCCKTVRIYEYDQVGNWIKQTVQSVEPATDKVIAEWFEERKIEYY